MLRDVPKIYMIMFGVLVALSLLAVWYVNNFQRGDDTLQLNDVILSNTVSEVDPRSRMYEGALLLSDTFESGVFKPLDKLYEKGDSVQFDYKFDTTDTRFHNVESGIVSSPTYIIGGEGDELPQKANATYMTGRPIQAVRIKVHEKDDKVGKWTYTSTVTVDAASKKAKE